MISFSASVNVAAAMEFEAEGDPGWVGGVPVHPTVVPAIIPPNAATVNL